MFPSHSDGAFPLYGDVVDEQHLRSRGVTIAVLATKQPHLNLLTELQPRSCSQPRSTTLRVRAISFAIDHLQLHIWALLQSCFCTFCKSREGRLSAEIKNTQSNNEIFMLCQISSAFSMAHLWAASSCNSASEHFAKVVKRVF